MCRSPHLTRAYSMARHRRAGARGAVLRPSPLRGGWLRPGPPRWPACRCSAPLRGPPLRLQRWAACAAPSPSGPGFAFACARPAPPVGSGLGLVVPSARCAPPPRAAPRCWSLARRVPPSAPLAAGRGALAVGGAPPAGASLCSPAGSSAAAAAVGAACAAQAYKADGFAIPAAP